ncbi:MAG: hypothetical protein AB1791_20440 [Chloroflexota bacterium]
MLTYKAMYKYVEGGVRAEVLDFPGVVSFGGDLPEARRLLAATLVDMAETNLLAGRPLPLPDPTCTHPDADVEEPIHLLLRAMIPMISRKNRPSRDRPDRARKGRNPQPHPGL